MELIEAGTFGDRAAGMPDRPVSRANVRGPAEPPSLIPATVSATARAADRWPCAFGSRFFVALILGLVWIGPAWWDARFLFGMAAWDALVLVAWAVDCRRLTPPAAIEISRAWRGAVGLEEASEVRVRISQRTGVSLYVTGWDDVPVALCSQPPHVEWRLPPQGSAGAGYTVRPASRGDFNLGFVYVRYQSAIRLAERRAVAELRQTVRVYPGLRESTRHTLYLIRSRQIEMEKRFKRHPGSGREFESLREYRQGDEPRDICWTASARRAKLVSKAYRIERSQAVIIVLDAGRLMLARTGSEPGGLTKLDCAVNAALGLARVALYSGDSLGFLAYGRKFQAWLPVGRGAPHLRVLLDELALVHGELSEADHARAAGFLLSTAKRRSLMIWLTDLAETAATPEVIESAARLLPRHLALFAVIGQPQLYHLVAKRPTSVTEMYRYVVAQEMIVRRELLMRQLRQQGALAIEFAPDQLAAGLVNDYLEIKERSML